VKPDRESAILVCAQFMSEGSGGIAEVARMTAKSLSSRYPTRALACQDQVDFSFGNTSVRSFQGSRVRFVGALALASLWATHIVHDFAGTARAQRFAGGGRRRSAVWAHGIEVWDRPRPDRVQALRRSDLVLVNSAYTMARAVDALKDVKHVRLCRLGTTSDEAPTAVGPSDGPPTVLLLGRIDPQFPKGHDLLISIWPKVVSALPTARLLFVGGGPALGAAHDLARQSSVTGSIEFAGFVPGHQIDAVWRRATLMAMPSYEEGFGLVFIEAMRRGIPVIASREDAGQEINLDGVTGFNLSHAHPTGVADAIIHLLRDRDASTRMGAAGHRRWRDHFGFSSFDQRLQEAIADFLSS
jgi:phosphatidyl-myo-inositol dimannoside synthase